MPSSLLQVWTTNELAGLLVTFLSTSSLGKLGPVAQAFVGPTATPLQAERDSRIAEQEDQADAAEAAAIADSWTSWEEERRWDRWCEPPEY